MKRSALCGASFALLISLAVFSLSLYRSSVPGCQLFSLGEMVEQVQPPVGLSLWQFVVGSGIGASRLLSVLLMAITLAVAYRLAADICRRVHGSASPAWAMLVVALIAVPLASFGWMTIIATTCAAVSLYILLLWRVSSQRQPRLWLDTACLLIGFSLATVSVWWLLMLFSGIYLLVWSPTRRVRLGVAFLLCAAAGVYLWIVAGTPLPWPDLFGSFGSTLPAISGVVIIIGLGSMVAWWLDHRADRIGAALGILFLTAGFLPLLISVITGAWAFVVMPAFVMPLGVSLWLGAMMLPLRVRIPAALAVIILLIAPRHLGVPNNDDIAQLYRQQYSAGTPLIVGFPGDYAGLQSGADIVSQLCAPPADPVYYLISESAFIAVTPPGHAALVPIEAVRSLPRWLMIARRNYFDPEIASHTQQIGLSSASGLSLFIYNAPNPSP